MAAIRDVVALGDVWATLACGHRTLVSQSMRVGKGIRCWSCDLATYCQRREQERAIRDDNRRRR